MEEHDAQFEVAVQPLRHANDVVACAKLMAGSEPWITLRRGYQDAVKLLEDSAKEVYVALVNGGVAGFLILDMRGPFAG